MDLKGITGFEWDRGNARKNEKHGVAPVEVEEVFMNRPIVIAPDAAHSQLEARFLALGKTNAARRLAVVFTLREMGTMIRPISARTMNRKERARYEEAT